MLRLTAYLGKILVEPICYELMGYKEIEVALTSLIKQFYKRLESEVFIM